MDHFHPVHGTTLFFPPAAPSTKLLSTQQSPTPRRIASRALAAILLVLCSSCSLYTSRFELTKEAMIAYQAKHDDEALKLFMRASAIPGPESPGLGAAHIMLLKDALDGTSENAREAIAVLQTVNPPPRFKALKVDGYLYQQLAYQSLGLASEAMKALSDACDTMGETNLKVCAAKIGRIYRNAGSFLQDREYVEEVYLISLAQYRWTQDPIFVRNMLGSLVFFDLPRAIALKTEKIRTHEFDEATRNAYCLDIGRLNTDPRLSQGHFDLVKEQMIECGAK